MTKAVFASAKMRALQARMRQVAGTDSTVLITGESGSGKEVIARLIHEHSPRKKNPFVAVNCASFPGSLMEVELFGYEKGAFTGAHQRHKGLFEQAHGGTLLLDEIAELDPGLQAKFLRVLQDRRFRRVGGESEIGVDVRLLASTHRNLKKLVEEGKFREDLFYRISVFPVEVPPLRDRPEDIVALTAQYIEHFNKEMGKRIEAVTEETKSILQGYAWPGNVRELRNTIERVMIIREEGLIHPEELPIEIITGVQRLPEPATPLLQHIPPPVQDAGSPGPKTQEEGVIQKESVMGTTESLRATDLQPQLDETQIPVESNPQQVTGGVLTPDDLVDLDKQIERFEKERIKAALKLASDNQSEAARLLGIRRDTLRFRMKKHKLL